MLTIEEINRRFLRAEKYDLNWVFENHMGPNVLWLAEAATEHMDLKPGMRVLDMGCGKALSSIFLAREFGVQVWATDLWISPTENYQRIQAAGVEDRVFPIHAEAHSLPYAEGFFDAAISLDAYHYFGTNDIYYGWYFNKLLKPGAQLSICVPGIKEEIAGDEPPAHLKPYWDWEYFSFHSPDWWARHFRRSGMMEVEYAGWLEDGWKYWLAWDEGAPRLFPGENTEATMLREDAGRWMGFSQVVARKK
jgi:cyclopropane fatty-acyl-phospholipid synthase-like methyltransferase